MGGPEAVVDPNLRVRGVSALRVVDGSIMPSMVSANTNGPIMAIAWRAAELIHEQENQNVH
jgi:choline dehydrogenase